MRGRQLKLTLTHFPGHWACSFKKTEVTESDDAWDSPVLPMPCRWEAVGWQETYTPAGRSLPQMPSQTWRVHCSLGTVAPPARSHHKVTRLHNIRFITTSNRTTWYLFYHAIAPTLFPQSPLHHVCHLPAQVLKNSFPNHSFPFLFLALCVPASLIQMTTAIARK